MAEREPARGAGKAMRAAIIFDNFGPYHVARLAAAAQVMAVSGIEVGGRSAEYAWDRPADGAVFERVALFPGPSREQSRAAVTAAMEQALDRIDPNIVAIPGWADRAGLAALRWALRRSVPVVVMSESNAADHARGRMREWVKRRLVGLCAGGLAGGSRAAAYLSELGMPAQRVAIGYDVVDNAYFANGAAAARRDPTARTKLGLPDRFFLVCCRLVEKKNLAALLDAFAEYRRASAAGWSLVISGDGPLRGALQEQAARLGIAECVHFAGFVQYDDLPLYYGLASAFVLPSTTEQWGLVVNEAMAAGLPVLVSDRCGCAADLVADGRNGFVFDPVDRASLTGYLTKLAETTDLTAMGQASERIIAAFSPDRFASGLQAAALAAQAGPARPSLAGRVLLAAMVR